MAVQNLWVVEDVVTADSTPDDVDMAGSNLSAVLEGSATVVGPGHLSNASAALDPIDPQTGADISGA
jgi:hypothetical protein